MSLINSAASAYHIRARMAAESSQPNAAAPAASAPVRETELARQLDTRLTGELSRIRQQINSVPPPAPSSSAPSNGRGQRLDVRA